MAKSQWFPDQDVAVAVVVEVVEIAAAETGAVDGYLNFVR